MSFLSIENEVRRSYYCKRRTRLDPFAVLSRDPRLSKLVNLSHVLIIPSSTPAEIFLTFSIFDSHKNSNIINDKEETINYCRKLNN